MANVIELYICSICKSYCDGEECYSCDETSGVLTQREDTSEKDLATIKSKISKYEHVTLFLSEFGDAPAEIAIIRYNTDSFLNLLQTNQFVFNDISEVFNKGEMQSCIGVAFLNPVKFKDGDKEIEVLNKNQLTSFENTDPVYGIMIYIN